MKKADLDALGVLLQEAIKDKMLIVVTEKFGVAHVETIEDFCQNGPCLQLEAETFMKLKGNECEDCAAGTGCECNFGPEDYK